MRLFACNGFQPESCDVFCVLAQRPRLEYVPVREGREACDMGEAGPGNIQSERRERWQDAIVPAMSSHCRKTKS
jgi:hypothetical protein